MRKIHLPFGFAKLKQHKVLFVFLLALSLALASFLFVLSPVQTAQADPLRGFPLYTWGDPANGRLGRPVVGTDNQVPVRMGAEEDWVMAASAAGGSKAIDTQRRLWTWGPSGNQRGLGGASASVPTQITNPPRNWVHVASLASTVAAVTDQGHLYTWGTGANGQLGHGDYQNRNVPTRVMIESNCTRVFTHVSVGTANGALTLALTSDGHIYSWGSTPTGTQERGFGRDVDAANPSNSPGRVETPHNNWVHVESGGGRVGMAICADGYLYSWGDSAAMLGRATTAANPADRPARVMLGTVASTTPLSNVVDVVMTNGTAAAVCENGYLYTWGGGQLGRPTVAGADNVDNAPASRAGRVNTNSNWTAVMGGWLHFIALTNRGQIFAWGSGADGRLGLGDTDSRAVPTSVGFIIGAAGAARGGGSHTMVLMDEFSPFPAVSEYNLYKHLQKPYGTPTPNLTFSFTMVARSFNDSSAVNFTNNFPNVTIGSTTQSSANITRSITIDSTSTSTPTSPGMGDMVTLSDYVDLLDGIEFDRRGIFSWTVTEVQTTPVVNPPSNLVFSQAQYELRVYVAQRDDLIGDFYIRYTTLQRLRNADGTIPSEVIKPDYLIFENQYTRRTAANQHFEISKYIDGIFADLSETFTFAVTLTRTALCPSNRQFVGRAQVQNAQGVWIDTSPLRAYTFTTTPASASASQNVVLGHNQRLIFDGANAITLGSTFLVVEAACPLHIASVRVYSYNSLLTLPTPPNYVEHENAQPNQTRTTYAHTIGANRNAALFTNAHQWDVPTGLALGAPTYVVVPLFTAGIALAATFARRARKRIEELPTVH